MNEFKGIMNEIDNAGLTDSQCKMLLMFMIGWLGRAERIYNTGDVKRGFELALAYVLEDVE